MEKFCVYFAKFLAFAIGICLIALAINDYIMLQENIGLMNGVWHFWWM